MGMDSIHLPVQEWHILVMQNRDAGFTVFYNIPTCSENKQTTSAFHYVNLAPSMSPKFTLAHTQLLEVKYLGHHPPNMQFLFLVSGTVYYSTVGG